MTRHNALRPIVLGLFAATAIVGSASALPIVYSATLDAASESPPNSSTATGFTIVTVDPVAHTMRVQVSFSGLTGANTAAHIHCCTATPGLGTAVVATPTPTFPGFPATVSGTYDRTFDMSVLASYRAGFVTSNGGTAASAEAALFAGIAAGSAYLNIHTVVNPGGEIRGFLAPVPAPATAALLGAALLGLGAVRRRAAA